MARTRKVDVDTYIGYSFLGKQFYVTNKGTTTYRTGKQDILNVLDIVTNGTHSITMEILNALELNLEEVSTLYYTLSDNASYVASIQFNDYFDFPLVLLPDENKLYVKNSTLVFDLSLNESRDNRVALLSAYYRDRVGVNIPQAKLNQIYNLLIEENYKPSVHNLVLDKTEPLIYSNLFACSNYNGKGKSTYECEVNPNQDYSQKETVAYIVKTNSDTNTITLTTTVPTSLKVGSTIEVKGATKTGNTYTSSADGSYTIKKIQGTEIYTDETVKASYSYNFPVAYSLTSETSITSIDRDTYTITLETNVPDTIKVGDIIHVLGTQVEVEGETVTCDGSYIVGSISENTIITQNQPPVNYTGTGAFISKWTEVGKVTKVEKETESDKYVISLFSPLEAQISALQYIVILYNNEVTLFNLSSYTSISLTCQYVNGNLKEYSTEYPVLQVPIPSSNILIAVTSSSDEDVLPTGEFMVDDFNQCQEYLGLLDGNVVPTNSIIENIGKEVAQDIYISADLPVMKFAGLYPEVYGE